LKLRGVHGAFGLGLAYGILSGSCTFGFIAPILAVVTVQNAWATGSLMMILFALGHCLPIVIAGSSTALVRKLTENHLWQGAGNGFRKAAGVVVAVMGLYFMVRPFIDSGAV
jgi:cytochrome c-type biogenesis protein